jgi:hypothetical protein
MNRMLLALGTALLALSACATISISASWQKAGDQRYAYKKIAVVALSGQKSTRRMIENNVLWALGDLGIPGVAGNDVIGDAPSADQKEVVRKRLQDLGVDGAITLRLVARTFKEKTVAAASADDRYQDFYYGYYAAWDPVYRDATVDVDTKLVLEAILYRLDEHGAVAMREITLKKRTGTGEEVTDATKLLVESLHEAGLLTSKK